MKNYYKGLILNDWVELYTGEKSCCDYRVVVGDHFSLLKLAFHSAEGTCIMDSRVLLDFCHTLKRSLMALSCILKFQKLKLQIG